MRGGPLRAPLRLGMYLSLVCLPMLVGSAAYAAAGVSPARIASLSRLPGPIARPLPSPSAAAPVTTVLAPSSFEQLQSDLADITVQSGAWVGISLQDLSGPRRNTLSLNGSQSFYAASAYKLPLLMAEAQQVVTGEASLSDVLCFDPSDAEDGWFNDYEVGSCFTRDELAMRAGHYSDNTAAHILVRYLGGPDALNSYAKSIGMSASALWNPNTTTTDDLIAAWLDEVLGRLGGEAAQNWLYPVLTHTANEEGIPAGIPSAATVTHKVGTMYGTENDSAYVVSGRTSYVVSIAVDGIDESAGWSLIARISERIWQYEASRPDFVAAVEVTQAASDPRSNRH
jgi:beta-lactamase class A